MQYSFVNNPASNCYLFIFATWLGHYFLRPRACACEEQSTTEQQLSPTTLRTYSSTVSDGSLPIPPLPRPADGPDEAVCPAIDTTEEAIMDGHQTDPASSKHSIASISLIGTIPYGASRNDSWLYDAEKDRESREDSRVTSRESIYLSDVEHIRPRRESHGQLSRHFDTLREPHSQSRSSSRFHTGKRHLQNLKRELDPDLQDVEPRPCLQKRPRQLAFDLGGDRLTLTEQISRAGETAAIAAHVEDFETMGRGAGGRMPSADILGLIRESLGNTRADAPGIPGSGHSAFALCGVVAQVEKIMIDDAGDPEDAWYGGEYLSLDSEDSEIFVIEGRVMGEVPENIMMDATDASKPESDLLDWPGWLDDGVEKDSQRD